MSGQTGRDEEAALRHTLLSDQERREPSETEDRSESHNRGGHRSSSNNKEGFRIIQSTSWSDEQREENQELFCSNKVVTAKYTPLTFLPIYLFEQFTRFANAFFLAICVFQTIPAISITGGIPTQSLALSFVLLFDGIVTVREDYKRHRDDKLNNSCECLVNRKGRFVSTCWEDVTVGDILKIRRDETIPADCVLLSAYSHDFEERDICYVETAQLDGETNLKLRQASYRTMEIFQDDRACGGYRGSIECEQPTAVFEKFVGSMTLYSKARTGNHVEFGESVENSIPLTADQTILRGCIVRSVDYVYAMAVYTGDETKSRVKQTSVNRKKAQTEEATNRIVVFAAMFLLFLCGFGSAGNALWTLDEKGERGLRIFLELPHISFGKWVLTTLTFFLLNSQFIPISLYVTMRLARTFQMTLMELDKEMQYRVLEDNDLLSTDLHSAPSRHPGEMASREIPFKVRSMELNDDIGQITHIFSDKTGTMTSNHMEFRKFMANGIAYGNGTTSIGIHRRRREGREEEADSAQRIFELQRSCGLSGTPHVNFCDTDTASTNSLALDSQDLSCDDTSPEKPRDPYAYASDGSTLWHQGEHIREMLLHLSVNHTVIVETIRDEGGRELGKRFSGSSPDEQAFVYACTHFGYCLTSRVNGVLTLRQTSNGLLRVPSISRLSCLSGATKPPQKENDLCTSESAYEALHVLDYTQERKRMSVLVQHPNGRITLYCKGADSVIFERLRPTTDPAERRSREKTSQMIAEWGNDGLRTLCFAFKDITPDEYNVWSQRYAAACESIQQRALMSEKQPNDIEKLMEIMEQDLILQGATANEDKLQEGVPETMSLLSQGGIRIWMLTGDKQETASNIGYATYLLDETMYQVVAAGKQGEESARTVSETADILRRCLEEHPKQSNALCSDKALNIANLKEQLLGGRFVPGYQQDMGLESNCLEHQRDQGLISGNFALILDDKAIDSLLGMHVDEDNVHRDPTSDFDIGRKRAQDLLLVGASAKAVICCRTRPDQKAAIVQLVRNGFCNFRTLAIGDGANDVNMIRAAHVGVGISGKEGVQASNASDFSFGQFRFLQRLLLVHGQWNYRRMSMLVLYMFYKNLVFVIAQFWYSLYNGWSGQKFYVEYGTQTYNLIYTGLPILIFAILDQQLDSETLLKFPEVYRSSTGGSLLNSRRFALWFGGGLFEALVIFYGCTYGVHYGDNGESLFIFSLGTVVFTSVVVVVNIRLAFEFQLHAWFTQLAFAAGVLVWIPMCYIFGLWWQNDLPVEGYNRLFGSPAFYFSIILVSGICSLRAFLSKSISRYHFRTLTHVLQEIRVLSSEEKLEDFRKVLDRIEFGTRQDIKIPDASTTNYGNTTITTRTVGQVLKCARRVRHKEGTSSPRPPTEETPNELSNTDWYTYEEGVSIELVHSPSYQPLEE
eukprot:gb/GECG01011285.1/.p1 GENE.gb/GECG01011285.1/~~gb/GECG01011285.1/.p1  ORF type:complete len:1420 (+),score=171.01 gb/GECG01011285.1/:1-4260(+)